MDYPFVDGWLNIVAFYEKKLDSYFIFLANSIMLLKDIS